MVTHCAVLMLRVNHTSRHEEHTKTTHTRRQRCLRYHEAIPTTKKMEHHRHHLHSPSYSGPPLRLTSTASSQPRHDHPRLLQTTRSLHVPAHTPTTNNEHTSRGTTALFDFSKRKRAPWTYRHGPVRAVHTGTLLQHRSHTAIVSLTCSSNQLCVTEAVPGTSVEQGDALSNPNPGVHEPRTFLLRSYAINTGCCLSPVNVKHHINQNTHLKHHSTRERPSTHY